jgi:hypothetical protein
MRTRRFLVGAAVVVGLASFSGAAAASPGPSVSGAGMITLPPEYGNEAGDQVLFQLQAQGGETPWGTFNVVHVDDSGGLFAHVVGDIACVSVSDGVAVTTGIIRHAWFRDFPGALVVNTGVAITVADNGKNDALGFDFEFFEGEEILPCDAVPPVIRLARGAFAIR